jgi:hypothetical protein
VKINLSTLLLFFVLLLLIGIYFFVNNFYVFDKSGKVFELKNGNLVAFDIISDKTSLKFLKDNNFWEFLNDKSMKLDEKHLSQIEFILNNLKYSRVIKGTSSDLSSFGFGKPKLKIIFKTDNGITNALYCGDLTPSKTEYYVKKDNSEEVYLVNKGNIDVFFSDISFYKDKNILSIDSEHIESIETKSVSGERLKFIKSDNKWKLVFPVKAEIRNDIMVEVINKLKSIQVREFITLNNENMRIFNLEKSDYQIIIGDSNNKFQTIFFGKKENGNIYFKTDDKKAIFSMSSMTFNADDIRIGELLNESPLSIGIDKIKKIVIKTNDQIIEIKKDEFKPDITFTKNGKEINKQNVISLYINIMAVKATGFGMHDYLKPEFSIILEQINSNKSITAEFVRKDQDSYYLFLNKNSSNFIVSSTQIDEIKKWLRRI